MCGETVTFGRLLQEVTAPQERLALLASNLEDQIATVFRQIAMNRFEDAIHIERREAGELSVERFGELARYASVGGGTVALEGHVGQAIDQPEKVVWLMQAVNSPHFRFNIDNRHFEVIGSDMDD